MTDLTRLMFDDGATRPAPPTPVHTITLPGIRNSDGVAREHAEGGPAILEGTWEDTGIEVQFGAEIPYLVTFFDGSLWMSNGRGLWAWVNNQGHVLGYIDLASFCARSLNPDRFPTIARRMDP